MWFAKGDLQMHANVFDLEFETIRAWLYYVRSMAQTTDIQQVLKIV